MAKTPFGTPTTSSQTSIPINEGRPRTALFASCRPFCVIMSSPGAARSVLTVESSSSAPCSAQRSLPPGRGPWPVLRNPTSRSRFFLKLRGGDGALSPRAAANHARAGEADQHQRPSRRFRNRREGEMPDAKGAGIGAQLAIGVASWRRHLAVKAENIDELAGGGLKRDAHGAGERKPVGEKQVVGAFERARSGDLAAIDDSGNGVDRPNARALCWRRVDRPASWERNPAKAGKCAG
jgi:hypothetical protein